jgi:lipoprotein-anchoring transpeptidase ErfK/SrfK
VIKILPIIAIVGLLVLAFTLTPIRREIVYKLGISGDPTTSCCDPSEVANQTGNFDQTATQAIFNNQIIDYPKTSLAQLQTQPNQSQTAVLGTYNAAGEEKWIEVSLDQQMLRAWEGNKIVMEFPISSGKWWPTPKGDYNIWYKTRSQSMIGGSKELGTYYNLPNVPFNMFFYQGYAVHGAYWHNNFGQPMSHGCVNAPIAQVGQLFEWSGPVLPPGVNALKASADNPGTRVFVH